MKYLILFLAITLSVHAQSPAPAEVQSATSTVDSSQIDANQAAANLHANLLELVELSGVRNQVPAMWKSMVEDSRKQMKEQCELCSRKFTDEWVNRMLAGLKVDDVIQIWMTSYEKHFTAEEIVTLVDLQKKTNAHEKLEMTPELAAKLDTEMPIVKNEFNDGFAELAGDLGSTITSEIEKQHPEYLNTSDKDSK